MPSLELQRRLDKQMHRQEHITNLNRIVEVLLNQPDESFIRSVQEQPDAVRTAIRRMLEVMGLLQKELTDVLEAELQREENGG